MLREDVVASCASGRFQVCAVDTVHEALECLTGMPAGRRQPNGSYPPGTVLALALDKAFEYWLKASQRGDLLAPPPPEETAERPAGRRRRNLRGQAGTAHARKPRARDCTHVGASTQ